MKTKRTGLIMEGGTMRGMFTCAVIDVLMENGIEFDGAIVVSAGAAFGCIISSAKSDVRSAITNVFATTSVM